MERTKVKPTHYIEKNNDSNDCSFLIKKMKIIECNNMFKVFNKNKTPWNHKSLPSENIFQEWRQIKATFR